MKQHRGNTKDSYYYRAEKLTGNRLGVAARHNMRTIAKEMGAGGHIDPLRSRLNYSLAGCQTPKAVNDQAKALMKAAGVGKLRKDAVKAIEIVFSLPVGTSIDHREYFTACLDWTIQAYSNAPILAGDVHLDETAPHCHVILLPLIENKMNGSDLMGGKALMSTRRNDFYECVASRFALTKPPKKHSEKDSAALYEQVMEHVRLNDLSALKSALWPFTRDAIRDNPVKAAQLLGIEIPEQTAAKKLKTVAEIFTSKGAGAKTESNLHNPNRVRSQKPPAKPIGTGLCDNLRFNKSTESDSESLLSFRAEKPHQTLSCVGFAIPPSVSSVATKTALNTIKPIEILPNDHTQDTFTESTSRIPEGSILANHWNFDLGEFHSPPPAKHSLKPAYDRMVNRALSQRHHTRQ